MNACMLLLLFAFPGMGNGGGISWQILPEESQVYVRVYKDASTLLAGQAHNHVIRATGWQGIVKFDPAALDECFVSALLPVEGLRADEDGMRKTLGMDGTVPASDRSKVEKHMKSEDQLDAATYPFIRFRVTGCKEGDKPDLLVASASLAIRSRKLKLEIPVIFALSGNSLKATGTFEARHADFGFKPYSAMMGAVANREKLEFSFSVVAQRRGNGQVAPTRAIPWAGQR